MVDPVVKPENAKIKRPPNLNDLAVFRIGVTGFEPFAQQTGGHPGPEGLSEPFTVDLQGFYEIPGKISGCYTPVSGSDPPASNITPLWFPVSFF